MNYHYQAKMDTVVTFEITDAWLKEQILDPLTREKAVVVNCEVKSHDAEGNHLTTGHIYWQVKNWKNVKTKI